MDWVNLPFAEAVRFLRQRWPMTSAEFAELDLEVRNRAFTVSRVFVVSTIQDVLDHLTELVASGGTLREFEERLDEVFASSGVDELAPWHLETVFRTDVQAAYGRGRWEQGNDPEVRDELAGWQYVAVNDDRTRDEHAALDGLVFGVGEMAEVFPPWDFNCRCGAIWLTRAEAEAAGLDVETELPDEVRSALGESGFASPALGDIYAPDLAGVHPRVLADFVEETQRRTTQ